MWMHEFTSDGSTRRTIAILVILFLITFAGRAEAQGKEETFIYAAVEGDLKKVEAFLNYGANVNAKGWESNRTALMWASLRGHLDVVRLLLEKGADVKARDKKGRNALITPSWVGQ